VMARRDQWLKALEDFRQQSGVDNPLDLGLTDAPFQGSDKFDPVDLAADAAGIIAAIAAVQASKLPTVRSMHPAINAIATPIVTIPNVDCWLSTLKRFLTVRKLGSSMDIMMPAIMTIPNK